MGVLNQATPLAVQNKDKEAQRGAMTRFKATELSGWQIQAPSTNQNKKTGAKRGQALVTVRKKQWEVGGGGTALGTVALLCPPPLLPSLHSAVETATYHFRFHSVLGESRKPHGNLDSLALLCVLG